MVPPRPREGREIRAHSPVSAFGAARTVQVVTDLPMHDTLPYLRVSQVSVLQVFYVSQVSGVFGVPQAKRLVGQAQLLNRRSDVTGLLTFTGSYFAQFFEGPAATVEALLQRIARDGRHCRFRELRRRLAPQREFPTWSMALLESPQLEADLAGLVGEPAPDDEALSAAFDRIRRDAQWQTVLDLPAG